MWQWPPIAFPRSWHDFWLHTCTWHRHLLCEELWIAWHWWADPWYRPLTPSLAGAYSNPRDTNCINDLNISKLIVVSDIFRTYVMVGSGEPPMLLHVSSMGLSSVATAMFPGEITGGWGGVSTVRLWNSWWTSAPVPLALMRHSKRPLSRL